MKDFRDTKQPPRKRWVDWLFGVTFAVLLGMSIHSQRETRYELRRKFEKTPAHVLKKLTELETRLIQIQQRLGE